MDNRAIDNAEAIGYNHHIRNNLMTNKFVLNTGEELTIEETIQLLLHRTNVLQATCALQETSLLDLTTKLENLTNANT